MHLRMDDTNPEKEDAYFATMIEQMVQWLGFDYDHHVYHASNYFETMFTLACKMIEADLAYVDFTPKENEHEAHPGGTLTSAGKRSEDANNTSSWHLAQFAAMRSGVFADGHCVLRAKRDMSSGNMNLRDPVLYRIKHTQHPRDYLKVLEGLLTADMIYIFDSHG